MPLPGGSPRPTPGFFPTAITLSGKKYLICWPRQAILRLDGRPLGKCRLKETHVGRTGNMWLLNSKRSMQAFGIYLVVVSGLGLMLVPHVMLGMLGLSAGDDAWIRMVGMLASIIGVYYLVAASAGIRDIIKWSIPIRFYAAFFMGFLFVSGTLSTGILLFAAIDALGAAWTWVALRNETESLPNA